jgi:hypothetical protein
LGGYAAATEQRGFQPVIVPLQPKRPPDLGSFGPLQVLMCGAEANRATANDCRNPSPTSNFNRRTSLILRTDNLLAGKLILPFEGEAACHCVVQRRYLPVEIIPAKPNAVPGSA